MAYENIVRLIGNLGADPKVVPLEDGVVAKLRLGQTKKWRDPSTGEPKEKVQWFTIDVYGHSAKYASEYLLKGMTVLVKGGLRNREWVDGEGTTRYAMDIVVTERSHEVQILSSPQKQSPSLQHQAAPSSQGSLKPSEGYATPPQNQNQANWMNDRPFGHGQ